MITPHSADTFLPGSPSQPPCQKHNTLKVSDIGHLSVFGHPRADTFIMTVHFPFYPPSEGVLFPRVFVPPSEGEPFTPHGANFSQNKHFCRHLTFFAKCNTLSINQLFNLSASRRNRFETTYGRTSKLQLFEFQKLNRRLSSPTIFSSYPFDSRAPLLSVGVGKMCT